MVRQIFFAHSGGAQGRSGQGSYDFVQWIRKQLEDEYIVNYPVIEDPEAPSYRMWKAMFDKEFTNLKGEVTFIGHSLGGSMLLKYFSEEKCELQINGVFLISIPFWGQEGWNVDDFILRDDFSTNLPELPAVHFFHCADDPVVPFGHLMHYQKIYQVLFFTS